MRANQHRSAPWPSLLLISVGAGLLARELGWLPAKVGILDFWPLFIVLIGISLLTRAGGALGLIFGLTFMGMGALLLAGNLGFVSASAIRFWPLLLVLVGLWPLFRRARGFDPREREPQPPPESDAPTADDWSFGGSELSQTTDHDRLNRQYTFAGAQIRIESRAWRGGTLGVTAGGVELDLRQAELDPEGAVLILNVLMGGVEIRVPDDWQVNCDVIPLFGGADDSTLSTQGASSAPRLRIVGKVTLGGVNVQN